ncbi:18441_t:CDS:2 [Gigaspora rosea]|nr:18441_t:CDS:2 [Gigaspora rosea]
MPSVFKGKRKAKNQRRNAQDRFCNSQLNSDDELNINDKNKSKDVSNLEWGDEEDNGWDDTENIETELNLIGSWYQKNYQFFNNVELQVATSQPLEPNDLDVDEISKNNQLQSMVFPEEDSDVELYEKIYSKLDEELWANLKALDKC